MRACGGAGRGGCEPGASAEAKRSRTVAPSTSVTAGAARTIGVRAGGSRSRLSPLTAYCCST